MNESENSSFGEIAKHRVGSIFWETKAGSKASVRIGPKSDLHFEISISVEDLRGLNVRAVPEKTQPGQSGERETDVTKPITAPEYNMHTPQEIGIDSFQSDRSPDKRYRTAPLGGVVYSGKRWILSRWEIRQLDRRYEPV
jgi:hypothetical protein